MGRKGSVQVNWNFSPISSYFGCKGSGVDTGHSESKKGVVHGARVITIKGTIGSQEFRELHLVPSACCIGDWVLRNSF